MKMFYRLARFVAVSLLVWAVGLGVATSSPARPLLAATPPGSILAAWGSDDFGELGDGIGATNTGIPMEVPLPIEINLPAGATPIAISAGGTHSLAIGSNSKLYAWGSNFSGELGDGTRTDRTSPIMVNLPAGVIPTAIAGGGSYSLASGNDGKLYAWGENTFGQLGDGTATDQSTPVMVKLPAGVTFIRVTAGHSHNLAIGSDGKLYVWGFNFYGQLGDGTTTNRTTPVVVNLPDGVTPRTTAGGLYHSLAIGSDGKLYAWGDNEYGELGDGTTTNRTTPVVVNLPAGVTPTAIAGGNHDSLAIGSDGKLYAWGDNYNGQLGDGTTTDRTIPIVVNLPAGVTSTAIASGGTHNLVIGSDGKLYAWGANFSGQLGDGTMTDRTNPIVTELPKGVVPLAITAGQFHSLAILLPPPSLNTEKADLIGKLRVTPDREFDLSGGDSNFLIYMLTVKNIGPGVSSPPAVQLPIDSDLQVAYASFSTDSVPGAFYEKMVTDPVTAVLPYAVLPYAQLRLPSLAPGQSVTATVAMRAVAGAKPAELNTRFAIVWDNQDGKPHHYYSNRVHLKLGQGTTRNETGGRVQFLSLAAAGSGLDEQGRAMVQLAGDIYAPGERVYVWYTDTSGKSTALGYVWANQYNGELNAQLVIPGWQSGQRYFLAALGDRSGVIGSATVLVQGRATTSQSLTDKESRSGNTGSYTYTQLAPLFDNEALQTVLKGLSAGE